MFGTVAEREQRLKELSESKGIHRLLEMLVKENSLVDRGANGRRYLLVKQALEETNMKLTLLKTVKTEIIKIFEDVAQRLTSVQELVKKAKVVKDAPLAVDLGTWVRGVTQSLASMAKKYSSETIKEVKLELGDEVKFEDLEKKEFEMSAEIQEAVTKMLEASQEKIASLLTKVQEADETEKDTETSLPDDMTKNIQELATSLKETNDKHSKPAEKKNEKVDKAGRPLSKDKVDALRSAKDMLERLLQSVSGDKNKSLPLGQTQDLSSSSDPNHPNLGAGLQPSEADVKTALEFFKKVPGLAEVFKQHAANPEAADVKKKLEKAESDLAESQKTVASQESTIENQARKLKEVPDGNSESETLETVNKNDEETSSPWSGDMAKPNDRESVEKRGGVFFGGDKD